MDICAFCKNIHKKDTKWLVRELERIKNLISKNQISFSDIQFIFSEICSNNKLSTLVSLSSRITFSSCFVEALKRFSPKIPLNSTGELDAILNTISTAFSALEDPSSTEYMQTLDIYENMEALCTFTIYGQSSASTCISSLLKTKDDKFFYFIQQLLIYTPFKDSDYIKLCEIFACEEGIKFLKLIEKCIIPLKSNHSGLGQNQDESVQQIQMIREKIIQCSKLLSSKIYRLYFDNFISFENVEYSQDIFSEDKETRIKAIKDSIINMKKKIQNKQSSIESIKQLIGLILSRYIDCQIEIRSMILSFTFFLYQTIEDEEIINNCFDIIRQLSEDNDNKISVKAFTIIHGIFETLQDYSQSIPIQDSPNKVNDFYSYFIDFLIQKVMLIFHNASKYEKFIDIISSITFDLIYYDESLFDIFFDDIMKISLKNNNMKTLFLSFITKKNDLNYFGKKLQEKDNSKLQLFSLITNKLQSISIEDISNCIYLKLAKALAKTRLFDITQYIIKNYQLIFQNGKLNEDEKINSFLSNSIWSVLKYININNFDDKIKEAMKECLYHKANDGFFFYTMLSFPDIIELFYQNFSFHDKLKIIHYTKDQEKSQQIFDELQSQLEDFQQKQISEENGLTTTIKTEIKWIIRAFFIIGRHEQFVNELINLEIDDLINNIMLKKILRSNINDLNFYISISKNFDPKEVFNLLNKTLKDPKTLSNSSLMQTLAVLCCRSYYRIIGRDIKAKEIEEAKQIFKSQFEIRKKFNKSYSIPKIQNIKSINQSCIDDANKLINQFM